jgi:hypothetical protein
MRLLKREPISLFYKYKGDGMGLFESTHLPDKISFALCSGLSRGLRCNDLMEPTFLLPQQAAGRAACTSGVDADLRRVPSEP